MEGGHIRVSDRDGNSIGRLTEGCYVGEVVGPVLNPRDKQDMRTDDQVEVNLNVKGLTLEQVKALQGRKVAVFPVQE